MSRTEYQEALESVIQGVIRDVTSGRAVTSPFWRVTAYAAPLGPERAAIITWSDDVIASRSVEAIAVLAVNLADQDLTHSRMRGILGSPPPPFTAARVEQALRTLWAIEQKLTRRDDMRERLLTALAHRASTTRSTA
jgi:hypothetical protein